MPIRFIRGVYAKDSEIINSVLIICFTEIMGVLNLIRKIFTIRHHQQYILLCGSQRRLLGVTLAGSGAGGPNKNYFVLRVKS